MQGWSHNHSSKSKQRFLTKQETVGLTYEERKFAEEQFKQMYACKILLIQKKCLN